MDSKTVKSEYLKVFSILVYCDKERHLTAFLRYGVNDERPPLDGIPGWAKSPKLMKLFDLFLQEQRMFYPFSEANLQRRLLDPRVVFYP